MKPMGSVKMLKTNTVTPIECLHYDKNLSTSVVITGCESIRMLEQAMIAGRSFRQPEDEEMSRLRKRTAMADRDGRFKKYKTGLDHDSATMHPQWIGGSAEGEDREMSGTNICILEVWGGMIVVRALTQSDLREVMKVQRSAYIDALVEPKASFSCKLRLPGSVALGAFEGGGMSAYLFCHPWSLGETAPLNACDLVLPGSPSCMYFHDLAVRPECRGRGLADRLVSEALSIAEARGLHACALVAVQSSRPFWERHGFRSQAGLEYGAGIRAHYMVRR